MNLRLDRTQGDGYGTFGYLSTLGQAPLCTLEGPWIEWSSDGAERYQYGKPYTSCVPPGSYKLVWHHSPRHGWSWHVQGEGVHLADRGSGRFACLFHAANWPNQVVGCISPGMRFDMVASRYGVSSSKHALQKLEGWLDTDQSHTLTIR